MRYEYGRAWQNRKERYIEEHGYECERCGASNNLQLHHLAYNHEEGTEPDEDIMLLCRSCHMKAQDDSYLHDASL